VKKAVEGRSAMLTHYNLALLYSDPNRTKEAVFELKKALRINPNYVFVQ
jgi:tetratricopeptide (TPR) repeat protein